MGGREMSKGEETYPVKVAVQVATDHSDPSPGSYQYVVVRMGGGRAVSSPTRGPLVPVSCGLDAPTGGTCVALRSSHFGRWIPPQPSQPMARLH